MVVICNVGNININLKREKIVIEIMLKWLVAGKEGEEEDLTITEDPLATLNLKKQKKRNEIYSVNR